MSDQDNLNNLSNELSPEQLLNLFTALNQNSPSYTFNTRPDIKATQEAIVKFATFGQHSTSIALEEISLIKQKQDELKDTQSTHHQTLIQIGWTTKGIFTGINNISKEVKLLGNDFGLLQETFINAANRTLILQNNYSENAAAPTVLEEVTQGCLEQVANSEIKICMLDAKKDTVYTLPEDSQYIFAYKFVNSQVIQAAVVESCQSFSLTVEEITGQDEYGNDKTEQVITNHVLMTSGDLCMMGDSASN